jgi:hypothetical protein
LFIGAVIFSKGASSQLGSAYELSGVECSELTRVALNKHGNPVSRIIRVCLLFIKSHNPGLRLIVSFADTYRHHCGGIYQAGNWIYTGTSSQSKAVLLADGNVHDLRRYNGHGDGKIVAGKIWKQPKKTMPDNASVVKMPGKHRYLMPLDAEMRARVLPLSKPYPKRPKKPDEPDQGNRGRGSTDPDAPSSAVTE